MLMCIRIIAMMEGGGARMRGRDAHKEEEEGPQLQPQPFPALSCSSISWARLQPPPGLRPHFFTRYSDCQAD